VRDEHFSEVNEWFGAEEIGYPDLVEEATGRPGVDRVCLYHRVSGGVLAEFY
jgi:hypothetical protein